MTNKNTLFWVIVTLVIIVGLSIILFLNFTDIPSSEGRVIVRQSGGQAMLVAECLDPLFVENTSDYIIEGAIEKVESKWNIEHNFIYTYSDFTIEKYIKGRPFGYNKIQIISEGGCIAGMCQDGEHSPIMDTGRKRLYLRENNKEFRIHGCGGIKTIESTILPQDKCIENDNGFDIYNKSVTKGLGGGNTGLFYKGTFLK